MAEPNFDIRGTNVALYQSFADMATPPRCARFLSVRDIVVGLSSTKTSRYISVEPCFCQKKDIGVSREELLT